MRKPLSLLFILLAACATDDETISSTEQAAGFICDVTLSWSNWWKIRREITAVPTGGTLCLYEGWYPADLILTRSITIVKISNRYLQGPVVLGEPEDGAAEARIVVNAGVHLRLSGIDIEGGTAGIRSAATPTDAVHPIVELENVSITGTGLNGGVSGRMHLKAYDLQVESAAGPGIKISGVADLEQVTVSYSGSGIEIGESGSLPTGWQRRLKNVWALSNGGPGARLSGAAYRVESSSFNRNTGFGVLLENAGGSQVYDTIASETKRRADGAYGDGITVLVGGSVSLSNIDAYDSARYGISAFGCPTLHPTVTVSGSDIYGNQTDIVKGNNAYCPTSLPPAMFSLGRGNLCSGGACVVRTGVL